VEVERVIWAWTVVGPAAVGGNGTSKRGSG